VIGAGIAGASFAYFAAAQGARVLMVEREAQPGAHSTGRSAAMFMESYGPEQVRALTRASRAFLQAPPAGFSTVPLLHARGALYVGGEAEGQEVDALEAALVRDGCGARRMTCTHALDLVPVLRAEAAAHALLDPDAADLDVNALHQGFLRGARARGAVLACDADVSALERGGDGWRVAAGARQWHAAIVVDAAGAWADAVGALAGAAPLGIEPRRRSAFTFAPPAGVDARAWPLVAAIDESWYFKPESGVLLGSPANADLVAPHDVVPEELDIATGIDRIERATALTIRRPQRVWAGLRSFVPGGELVGDFDDRVPGFFWVAGQGGYGIQTSVAMGAACAARVLGRPLPGWIGDAGLAAFGALALRRG
jgi:D-arginine dehydrogenase